MKKYEGKYGEDMKEDIQEILRKYEEICGNYEKEYERIMKKMLLYTWTERLGKIPGPPGTH